MEPQGQAEVSCLMLGSHQSPSIPQIAAELGGKLSTRTLTRVVSASGRCCEPCPTHLTVKVAVWTPELW